MTEKEIGNEGSPDVVVIHVNDESGIHASDLGRSNEISLTLSRGSQGSYRVLSSRWLSSWMHNLIIHEPMNNNCETPWADVNTSMSEEISTVVHSTENSC